MAKSNGGIIGPDNIPTGPLGTASGVWRLQDATKYQGEGLWPVVSGITYPVANSVRFNNDDGPKLTQTVPTTATSTRIMTWNFWVKRSFITDIQLFASSRLDGSNLFDFRFHSNDKIILQDYTSGNNFELTTNQVFRDVGSWYNIHVVIDTTDATADDRNRLYVNGTQVTSFSSRTNYALNDDVYRWNTSGITRGIGYETDTNTEYLDGYLSEYYFIDGQALEPASFGEFDSVSGNWKPKAYVGTYGNNGFYLNFQNSGALGTDSSGNGNNWTTSGLTSLDQTTDTPTNNFATMNPLGRSGAGTTGLPGFSEGNLAVSMTSDTFAYSTLGVASGKWYFEYKQTENTADNQGYPIVGFNTSGIGAAGDTIGFRTPSGTNYRGQLGTTSVDNAFLTDRFANDIFGFYLDLDNSTLIIYKNGSNYMNTGYTNGLDWSGGLTTTNGQTGFYFPYVQSNTANTFTDYFNFGNPPFSISSGNSDANGFGNFEYSPTINGVNYYAICTQNINFQG